MNIPENVEYATGFQKTEFSAASAASMILSRLRNSRAHIIGHSPFHG